MKYVDFKWRFQTNINSNENFVFSHIAKPINNRYYIILFNFDAD
jgi:hypothetical protein